MIETKKNQKCFAINCVNTDVEAITRRDAIVCKKHTHALFVAFGNLEFRKHIKIEGVVLE